MRRQEGSWGWRVAQVREVMRGCAVDVKGVMGARRGLVTVLGKRMGDMKGG